MKKLKILQAGFETYTGPVGMIDFVDGVSVDPVPRIHADRISGTMMVVEIDDEGNVEQAGPAQRIVGGATIPAEVLDPSLRSTDEEKDAEQQRLSLKLPEPTPDQLHTSESLEKIADEKGIAGLREIGKLWNVRERSIPALISKILEAQSEYEASKRSENAEREATPAPEVDVELVEGMKAVSAAVNQAVAPAEDDVVVLGEDAD